ncbi:MAG: hypothetical protein NT040_14220 [Bacteroidetes bacterium]|nr:hypothetical protein [Bacteroidota bacterium]
MGLASDMKVLTEELLASFKQRIRENEELVNDVQVTLDGFRKDHMELAVALNANAAALRKGLARGEKERLHNFNGLMSGIHGTIASIQHEVVAIQTSTFKMISEFTKDRAHMADDLDKTFAQGRADRMQEEKNRMAEFDALMSNIGDDIKIINDEVSTIFLNTNNMLDRFEKEHKEMSEELKAELGKNLGERVDYTRALLHGFQKRLSEIGRENQKMAQKLRKDLSKGETDRITDYNAIMKGIHVSIKGIQKEVRDVQKATAGMLDDLLQNRVDASAEWNKMQETMAHVRKTGVAPAPKQTVKKTEKKEVKKEASAEVVKETPVAAVKAVLSDTRTLDQKVLDYINKHPKGVKISEMEEPLGETRMKLGYTAKTLLDGGKVQKIDNIYYPIK